jgi:hypothetical protein
MKTLLRALGRIAILALLFVIGSIVYSTWHGYMRWYFRVDGQVLVDGQKTTGHLHANTDKTILLLTRTDGSRPETYLVSLGPTKTIIDCGEWHPLRFLPIPIGDQSPPVLGSTSTPQKSTIHQLRQPPQPDETSSSSPPSPARKSEHSGKRGCPTLVAPFATGWGF